MPSFGTVVATSSTTSTSPAATLVDTSVGAVNVLAVSANSTGTGVQPQIQAPTGWTMAFTPVWRTGSPSHELAVMYRVRQSGDPTTQAVSIAAAGGGNLAVAPFSFAPGELDAAIIATGEAVGAYAAGPTTNVGPAVTLGGARYVIDVFGNRSGATWSAAADGNVHDAIATQGRQSSSASVAVCYGGSTTSSGAARSLLSSASTSVNNAALVAFLPASGGTSYSGAAGLTSGSALTAAGAGSGAPSASLASASAITGAGTLAAAPAAALVSTSALTGQARTPITSRLLGGSTVWVAHRGGFATTLGECTLEAYQAACAQYSGAWLELPVWRSADGTYWVSHDRNTGTRSVWTGPSGAIDITTSTDATLAGYASTVSGNPMRRLTEILDALPSRFYVVDNKQDTNAAALISVLEGRVSGRWLGKQTYAAAGTWLTSAQNAGAPVWAYFYPADLGNLSSTLAALSAAKSLVVFGLGDFSAAPVPVQSDSNTFHTFVAANGLLSWAHIIGTTAQRSNADTQATTAGRPFDGYMTSGFATVAPTDALSGSLASASSLGAAAVPQRPGTAGLVSASTLTSNPARLSPATASLASASALTGQPVAAQPAVGGLVSTSILAGQPTAAPAGSAALGSVSALTGTAAPSRGAATLSSVSALSASPAESLPAGAGLTSSSSVAGQSSVGVAGSAGLISGSALGGLAQRVQAAVAGFLSGSALTGGIGAQQGTAALVSPSALTGQTGVAGPVGATAVSGSLLAGGAAAVQPGAAAASSASALAGQIAGATAGSAGLVSGSTLAGLLQRAQVGAEVLVSSSAVTGTAGQQTVGQAGLVSGSTTAGTAGAGALVAAGLTSASGLLGAVAQAATTAVGKLRVRLGTDRWLLRLVDRWLFRLGRGAGVRTSSKTLMPVQILAPVEWVDVQALQFCTSPDDSVPDAPDWQPLVLEDATSWQVGEWVTVHASVGPGLAEGTLYVIARVVTASEDVREVAGYRQVRP